MLAPVLGQYTDFRKYLKEFYDFKIQQSRGQIRPYSYSDFSAAADIKSPNYLKLIIEGKRNLSPDMTKKFARALKLGKKESREFALLVAYNQEKDPLLRNRYLKELSEFRAKKAISTGEIHGQPFEQVSDWLVWVLYAMVDQQGVRFETSKLRQSLGGQVNEAQINRALKKLVDNGLITIDEISKFAIKNKSMLDDVDKVPAELVRKIQSELIYLGLESLHRHGPKDREVSGVTLAMTEKEYEWVRFELRKLRKQVQKEIQTNREVGPGDRVYQFNVQLFPVTDKVERSRFSPSELGEKKSLEDPSVTK